MRRRRELKMPNPSTFNTQQLASAVAVIALIALILVIFSGRPGPLFGEAIISAPEAPAGQAGIFITENSEEPGVPFSVPVKANLGADKSVAVRFALTYDPALLTPSATCAADLLDALDNHFIIAQEGWAPVDLGLVKKSSCGNGLVSLEYVGMCTPPEGTDSCPNALTEAVDLANIDFTANAEGQASLTFTSFEVFRFDGTKIPLILQNGLLDIELEEVVLAPEEEVPEPAPEPGPAAPAEGPAAAPPAAEQPAAAAPSGGGGGGGCTPQWSCGDWENCDSNLKQTRVCVDTRCRRNDQVQTQGCSVCEESWTCTPWSDCKSGQQTRSCVDEHACGTYDTRPDLSKTCRQIALTTPPPAKVAPELPAPAAPTVAQPAQIPLWKNWRTYAGIVLSLVVIGAVALLVVWEFRKRRTAEPLMPGK